VVRRETRTRQPSGTELMMPYERPRLPGEAAAHLQLP
jgi:hypothetical protein